MKTKCYSVRVKSIEPSRSGKAYKVTTFDGSEDWIPSQFIFGEDYEVGKSDAYWIAEWILEKKSLQYSDKKESYFDSITRQQLPNVVVKHHVPDKVNKEAKHDDSLFK